jgi:hypothetical protein
VVSLLRLLYYWLDFRAGSAIRIDPLRRAGVLVVLERGYWDMAVDPIRYRLGVGPRVIEALGRWLPQPDVTVLLLGDAPAIAARTHELSVEEIDRQMCRWRQLAGRRTGWHALDATTPPERLLARTRALVLERRDRATHA